MSFYHECRLPATPPVSSPCSKSFLDHGYDRPQPCTPSKIRSSPFGRQYTLLKASGHARNNEQSDHLTCTCQHPAPPRVHCLQSLDILDTGPQLLLHMLQIIFVKFVSGHPTTRPSKVSNTKTGRIQTLDSAMLLVWRVCSQVSMLQTSSVVEQESGLNNVCIRAGPLPSPRTGPTRQRGAYVQTEI